MSTPSGRRPGRPAGSRTGQSPARDRILEAARRLFAEGTYASTTIRAVAAEAGVNVALVNHYFGGKRYLFAAALRLPLHVRERIASLVRDDPSDLGERLTRLYLQLWTDPAFRTPATAMIRSIFTDQDAAAALGRFLTDEMVGPVVVALRRDQPELRISLAVTQLVGLAGGRYILGAAPLVAADTEHLVACVGPTIQHYLTGELPRPPAP
ncbi:hypothetical protein AMK27_36315 [Streptomyces sp. CB02009]|uniref:TetR/AcrR family transcriptional regulator n=1 Tax=Streptomyces sp. CB02009 TaxID=1703938 RepID=UPI00093AA841|nr:TetR family transcriptional regulator [Streptomyces sp. CB02009]OKJ49526.1 hypothetical protein AMK27_36315 [Streptomyces sp. CB02009]